MQTHPEALKAFACAYEKAYTYIGHDAEKLLAVISQINPQETKDHAVALAVAKTAIALRQPPDDLRGKLGYIPPKTFQYWWDAINTDGIPGEWSDYMSNDYLCSGGS